MAIHRRHRWIGSGLSVAVALCLGVVLASPLIAAKKVTTKQTYSGTSEKGNFDEALIAAVSAAHKPQHPDQMTEWKLKEVSGTKGGIAGFNKITVTIEASSQ